MWDINLKATNEQDKQSGLMDMDYRLVVTRGLYTVVTSGVREEGRGRQGKEGQMYGS